MKIRVYLATTVGLVLIQRIQRETAPLSMVCRNGTLHEVQPMSGHYNAFVRAPSGVIEREFGPFELGGFRLDVAAEVGDGDSWQLGVFIAHALKSQEQLAEAGEEFAAAVVATGEVDHDLNAIRVGHVPAKIAAARAALADLAARVPTTFVLPAANAHQVPAEALPANVRLLAVASARDALATVAAPGSSPVEARPTPTAAPPPVPQRRRRLVGSAVAAAVIVLAIGGAWALLRVDGPVPGTPPPAAVPAPVAVAPPVQRAPDPGAEQAPPERPRGAGSEPAMGARPPLPPRREPVVVTVYALTPPPGEGCLAVEFGDARAALRRPLGEASAAGEVPALRAGPDLCGIEVEVAPGVKPAYVLGRLMPVSGRFAARPPWPTELSGSVALEGPVRWRAPIPRRVTEPIEYRLILGVAADPFATTKAARLDDFESLGELERRLAGPGVTIVSRRHRIDPP